MFDNVNQETPDNMNNNEGKQNLQPQNPSSSFDTLLSEIRNDRGEPKYRSVEDGLNALRHSQDHIRNLTNEKSQLEAEVASLRQKVSEIDELRATVQKLAQRPETSDTQNKPQLDEETIANLVDTRLTLKQQEAAKQANQRLVAAKLTERFGEKASESFYSKASQLGIASEDFEALAAKSPKAVLTMFGLDGDVAPKQTLKSPPQSQLNTEHFQGSTDSFIGAESERVPLGGGSQHFERILHNSRNMVDELRQNGMSVRDLTDPVNYMRYMRNKQR